MCIACLRKYSKELHRLKEMDMKLTKKSTDVALKSFKYSVYLDLAAPVHREHGLKSEALRLSSHSWRPGASPSTGWWFWMPRPRSLRSLWLWLRG